MPATADDALDLVQETSCMHAVATCIRIAHAFRARYTADRVDVLRCAVLPHPWLGLGNVLSIRRATVSDGRLWQSAVVSILSASDRNGRIATDTEVAAALADQRSLFFLALSGDMVVGLLSAYTFPDAAAGGHLVYLYDIEVLESHRRSGVGSALVEALKESCRAHGVRAIWAGTDVENQAARRTFERTGAEIEGDSFVEYMWVLT